MQRRRFADDPVLRHLFAFKRCRSALYEFDNLGVGRQDRRKILHVKVSHANKLLERSATGLLAISTVVAVRSTCKFFYLKLARLIKRAKKPAAVRGFQEENYKLPCGRGGLKMYP